MKILLVEDEQRIADIVAAGLGVRGFRVAHRADGEQGLDAAGDRQNSPEIGGLVLDRIARQRVQGAHRADLTNREYALLEYLMRSAGRVFTRRQILEHVWGYDFDPSTNVVDVCVRRIRERVASVAGDSGESSPVESVRGSGYRFRGGAPLKT